MRGKRLRGTPTSPSSPSEEGERNLFHLLGVGCPGSGMRSEASPGRVFLVSRTLLPLLPPASQGILGVLKSLLPTPEPTLGKDQGGKTHGKNLSAVSELQSAI